MKSFYYFFMFFFVVFLIERSYSADADPTLSAITWPDRPGMNMTDWGYDGYSDTIPGFDPGKLTYSIVLPPGTRNVPALKAIPSDPMALITTNYALNVFGGKEDRTSTIIVTTADRLDTTTYKVVFEVLNPTPQKYWGEAFISKVGQDIGGAGFIELTNPADVVIDVARYLIVKSTGTPADAILSGSEATETAYRNRYLRFIPAYKYEVLSSWLIDPGYLDRDQYNAFVSPREQFTVGQYANSAPEDLQTQLLIGKYNVAFNSGTLTGMDFTLSDELASFEANMHPAQPQITEGYNLYLFEVKNDSILLGRKPIRDTSDFKLIDAFGDPSGQYLIGGVDLDVTADLLFIRKPHIHKGNPILDASFNTSEDTDEVEWIVRHTSVTTPSMTRSEMADDLGHHEIDDFTDYMSTISSNTLLVSRGFTHEAVDGDFSSMTGDSFLTDIVKSDPNQIVSLESSVDGTVKDLLDLVENGDILRVVSASGENTTNYTLGFQNFSKDAEILAKSGTNLVIEVDGMEGTIRRVPLGSTVKELLNMIDIPESARMKIIDKNSDLLPLKIRNCNEVYTNTEVHDSLIIEVTAEDMTTVIKYKLDLLTDPSVAYVSSDYYIINQEQLIISSLHDGSTVSSLMRSLYFPKGVKARIVDNTKTERTVGTIAYDDLLFVVSEDETNTSVYYLDFLNINQNFNKAPNVRVMSKDTVAHFGNIFKLSGTVTDDGQPVDSITSYKWSIIGGSSAGISIENPDSLLTNLSFTESNKEIRLRLQVNDGERQGFDTLCLTLISAPTGIIDGDFCYGDDAIKSFSFYAEGSDIRWYSDPEISQLIHTGPIYYPSDTVSGSHNYYAAQRINGYSSKPDTANLIVYPDINISAEVSEIVCKNSNEGYINLSVDGGTPPYHYSWSGGGELAKLEGISPGLYSVLVTDDKDCRKLDQFLVDSLMPFPSESICVVTVDPDSGSNMLIWEPTHNKGIASYLIYKESNISNTYDSLGVVSFGDMSAFLDRESNPDKQSYRYKISVIDTCGNESPLSAQHATMHLILSNGLNGPNLIWNKYEGFEVESYNIWRGERIDNMFIIGSVSGSNFTFTDQHPLAGTGLYLVEAVSPFSCEPDNIRAIYNSSYSNIAYRYSSKIQNVSSYGLHVFPIPAKRTVTIEFPNPGHEIYQLIIADYTGKIVKTMDGITNNQVEILRDHFPNGLYLFELRGAEIFRGRFILN